jgi:hypothetical protein
MKRGPKTIYSAEPHLLPPVKITKQGFASIGSRKEDIARTEAVVTLLMACMSYGSTAVKQNFVLFVLNLCDRSRHWAGNQFLRDFGLFGSYRECWIRTTSSANLFLQPDAWSSDADGISGDVVFAHGASVLPSPGHDAAYGYDSLLPLESCVAWSPWLTHSSGHAGSMPMGIPGHGGMYPMPACMGGGYMGQHMQLCGEMQQAPPPDAGPQEHLPQAVQRLFAAYEHQPCGVPVRRGSVATHGSRLDARVVWQVACPPGMAMEGGWGMPVVQGPRAVPVPPVQVRASSRALCACEVLDSPTG